MSDPADDAIPLSWALGGPPPGPWTLVFEAPTRTVRVNCRDDYMLPGDFGTGFPLLTIDVMCAGIDGAVRHRKGQGPDHGELTEGWTWRIERPTP